jgi:hypothetical protein
LAYLHINKARILHRSVYLLIYGLISRFMVQVPVRSHRHLDGLCILHPKLLEDVLRVLCLGDEDAFIELFYLKS